MVVAFENPRDENLAQLASEWSSEEEGAYHAKREHGTETQYDSISPANAERRGDRHGVGIADFLQVGCKLSFYRNRPGKKL